MKNAKPTIAINLASNPFRRERATNVALTALCGLLAASLIVFAGLIWHAHAQASDLRRQIAQEQTQLSSLQREQAKYNRILAKPENADTFSTSVFLNQVIARRGVSWTRVFQDLATVMPKNVRLLAIRLPQIDVDAKSGTANRVELDMIVGTTQPEAVIGLLKNLQQSSLFGAAAWVSQNPPAQNDPLYKYRLTVPYDQKL